MKAFLSMFAAIFMSFSAFVGAVSTEGKTKYSNNETNTLSTKLDVVTNTTVTEPSDISEAVKVSITTTTPVATEVLDTHVYTTAISNSDEPVISGTEYISESSEKVVSFVPKFPPVISYTEEVRESTDNAVTTTETSEVYNESDMIQISLDGFKPDTTYTINKNVDGETEILELTSNSVGKIVCAVLASNSCAEFSYTVDECQYVSTYYMKNGKITNCLSSVCMVASEY
ncbi:MAG: hypothetical protein J6J60_02905 [Clostridia bacterium]|nr:hypothetical protein [Clostridia bacterium]